MSDANSRIQTLNSEQVLTNNCLSCRGPLELFYRPVSELMVASDAQPFACSSNIYKCQSCQLVQKIPDESYIKNIEAIYDNYSIAGISDGKDAMIGEISRSAAVIEKIQSFLPDTGSILDVGTGSGAFLRAAEEYTQLALFAHDINGNHGEFLEKISLSGTFICQLSEIEQQFDIISAIHVVEHVIDMDEFYSEIKRLLKPGGVFIVQVPQSNVNEFDLLIYDHVLHFSFSTLKTMLKRYFRYCIPVPNIYKQATLLVTDNPELQQSAIFSSLEITEFDGDPDVARLDNLIQQCQQVRQFMVFGTGPVSVYFAQLFHDRVVCFIDDDTCKHGKQLIGITVKSAADMKAELPMLIPFPHEQAVKIASRWENHDLIY